MALGVIIDSWRWAGVPWYLRSGKCLAAGAVVDPVLKNHYRVRPYQRGSWGAKEADTLTAMDCGWQNPILGRA